MKKARENEKHLKKFAAHLMSKMTNLHKTANQDFPVWRRLCGNINENVAYLYGYFTSDSGCATMKARASAARF